MSDGTGSGASSTAPSSTSAPSSAPAASGAPSSQSSTSAPSNGAGSSATPPTPAPWSLKLDKPLVVDGVEEPVEYTDPEALRLDLQLAKAARRRMQEAAKVRKENEEYRRRLKESPWDVLRGEGHDPRKLAAELLADEYERSKLTPEQQEALKERTRADTAEARLKEIEAERTRVAQEAADAAVWADFEPKLIAAAEKSALPNDEQTMDLLGRVGLEFANNGVELSPEHVVAETARRQQARTMRYVPSAPVPMLAQALKPMPVERLVQVLEQSGHLEQVRAALVARWRAKKAGGQAPAPQAATAQPTNGHAKQAPRDDENGRYISASEYRKRHLWK